MTAEIDRRHALRGPRHRLGTGIRQPLAPEAPVPSEALSSEAGIEARAPDLRVLFEEAAAALLRETGSPAAGPACRWEAITIRAHDLPGLAGLWLDRLIDLGASRLSDQRREAVVVVAVDRVASPDDDPQYGRWVLRARVGLRPYQEAVGASPREVRSASDRPLAVEQDSAGWRLRASLAI